MADAPLPHSPPPGTYFALLPADLKRHVIEVWTKNEEPHETRSSFADEYRRINALETENLNWQRYFTRDTPHHNMTLYDPFVDGAARLFHQNASSSEISREQLVEAGIKATAHQDRRALGHRAKHAKRIASVKRHIMKQKRRR